MAEGTFCFGTHVLSPRTRTLTRDGERVLLQDQPVQLLLLLVERAGDIVTRDEIRARLWPDTIIEYDQSINYGIRQIRIALGPDADLVQTVPRRGYRFTGLVARTGGGHVPQYARPGAAAALFAGFVSVFCAGVLSRHTTMGQFVYDHLVHPDRCPYMRIFIPPHRNS